MLKRFMNPGPTDMWSSIGLLVLRLAAGGMMIYGHGWKKLMALLDGKGGKFPDPLGVGNELSMALAVGAEVGAAALVMLGIFTRLAAVPLMFTMIVAAFIIHGSDPFAKKEMALLYLAAYTTLACTGAGRYSVDGAVR